MPNPRHCLRIESADATFLAGVECWIESRGDNRPADLKLTKNGPDDLRRLRALVEDVRTAEARRWTMRFPQMASDGLRRSNDALDAFLAELAAKDAP